jgi:hypothetical protein
MTGVVFSAFGSLVGSFLRHTRQPSALASIHPMKIIFYSVSCSFQHSTGNSTVETMAACSLYKDSQQLLFVHHDEQRCVID